MLHYNTAYTTDCHSYVDLIYLKNSLLSKFVRRNLLFTSVGRKEKERFMCMLLFYFLYFHSFICDSVLFAQFNKWLRDSKSRVLDIFRRMDHDRDGKLTREQFITGILNTSKRDILH